MPRAKFLSGFKAKLTSECGPCSDAAENITNRPADDIGIAGYIVTSALQFSNILAAVSARYPQKYRKARLFMDCQGALSSLKS
jgi:hypothetical protein